MSLSFSDDALRALGATLREIDPSALQSDPDDGNLRWFQGAQGTELFVWERLEGVDHAQLVFGDASIEWSLRTGVVTGEFTAQAAPLGGRYDPYLVRPAAALDSGLCRQALALLETNSLACEAAAPFLKALRAVVGAP